MKLNDIEVIVFRSPNLFAVNDSFYSQLGYSELEGLFTIEEYRGKYKNPVFFYPERFLNIFEQRALVNRILKAGYEACRIITHSPIIMQNCTNVKVHEVEGETMSEDVFKLSYTDIGEQFVHG